MSYNMFMFTSSLLSLVLVLWMPHGSLQFAGHLDQCGQFYESAICPDDYFKVGGVGCINISESTSTQANGKAYCQRINGELVIPEEFECLRKFIYTSDTYTRSAYWVGIENKTWLNGDPVLEEQTGVGLSQSGTMPCGYLWSGVDYHISGWSCNYIQSSICMSKPKVTCKPKNKCAKKGGSCILKGERCEGKITKHCNGGKNCRCCMPPKGSCFPKPKCEENFGHCIKKGEPCDGKVTKDCIGNKCRCCIPKEKCGRLANSDSCPEKYFKIGGVGCIHVAKEWHYQSGAKQYCQNLNGRLVVPEKFKCLQQFINESDTYNYEYYWVGVENKKWLNGDAVLDEQTGRGLSNSGPLQCAYLHEDFDYFLLGYGCGFSMPLICSSE